MMNLIAMVFVGGLLVGLSACWIGSRIYRWRREAQHRREVAELVDLDVYEFYNGERWPPRQRSENKPQILAKWNRIQ